MALGPDGALYLTDSGITWAEFAPGGKLRPDYLEAPIDGKVFRIDTETMALKMLDSGIRFTNGLAFGPNDDLYIDETLTGIVYRYRWRKGMLDSKREVFGNVIDPMAPEGMKGPDGMKFGANGNLYVTVFGQGDVTVLAPDGKVAERIKLAGLLPTNVAFGAPGSQKIYVTETEHGTLEVFDVATDGRPLYK